MNKFIDIKPNIGISELMFGATMKEVEKLFGKAEDIQLLDEVEDQISTVWHYWQKGISLFFDEQEHQLFCCVEIDNEKTMLWDTEIFSLNEKQIIELFKSKGFKLYETEMHDWGEKRLSFDEANIDFYFEKNKLVSINYGKPSIGSQILILPN